MAPFCLGHVYFFLVKVLPNSHGIDIVRTPQFCVSLMSWVMGTSQPSVQAATPNQSGRAAEDNGREFHRGGYNWGSGRTLGAN
jgi:hypothetical protein